jgi:hypothetical protein
MRVNTEESEAKQRRMGICTEGEQGNYGTIESREW